MSSVTEQPLSAGEVFRGSAAALSIKLIAAVMGFAMFALCSRLLDAAEFGTLAVLFAAMSFLAVVPLCGQETLIVRSWSEYCVSGRLSLARGALTFGALVVLGAGLLVTAVVAVFWRLWDPGMSMPLLLAACSFLFAQTLMHFSGQFSRVAAGVIIGDGLRDAMWRFLVVVAIAARHFMNFKFSVPMFFVFCSVSIVAAISIQMFLVARVLPHAMWQSTAQMDIRSWVPRAFQMWLSALLDAGSQYLEVVVIGLFLGPEIAGAYFVIARITNVFAMVAGSIGIYATSRISGLFYSRNHHALQKMLRFLAVISLVVVSLVLVIILVAGKMLLFAFGGSYLSAYPALVVVALGAAASAYSGPAGLLLLLTGHEGAYPRIVGAGMFLRYCLIAVLGPRFGLMGAALACSTSLLVTAVILITVSRRLVGVDSTIRSLWGRLADPQGAEGSAR